MGDKTQPLLDTNAELKPFLEAAEASVSSNVSTIRTLILKILTHPSIFCGFDQIKAVLQASIAADEALSRTLDLFSYGKYCDYSQGPGSFLTLTESQLNKLRQLTVLSVVQEACARGEGVITYDRLAMELGYSSEGTMDSDPQTFRRVEQVVIACMYAHILQGRLCQKTRRLLISSDKGPPCRSRDVRGEHIPAMMATLQALCDRLEASHAELETTHTSVQASLDQNTAYWKTVEEKTKKTENLGSSNQQQQGAVRGLWPERGEGVAARRSSATRRQSKRSRGGLGGSFTEPFQRY